MPGSRTPVTFEKRSGHDWIWLFPGSAWEQAVLRTRKCAQPPHEWSNPLTNGKTRRKCNVLAEGRASRMAREWRMIGGNAPLTPGPSPARGEG